MKALPIFLTEPSPEGGNSGAAAHEPGFTLVELLVVIAVIGILAALLFPALSRSKQKAQQVYCLNNGRQMITALTAYLGDSKDLYPPNPDDGNTIPGHNWCSGNAGRGQPQEFNPDVLKDPTRSLLAPYLQGNTSVFHCPGDCTGRGEPGFRPRHDGANHPRSEDLLHESSRRHHLPGI